MNRVLAGLFLLAVASPSLGAAPQPDYASLSCAELQAAAAAVTAASLVPGAGATPELEAKRAAIEAAAAAKDCRL